VPILGKQSGRLHAGLKTVCGLGGPRTLILYNCTIKIENIILANEKHLEAAGIDDRDRHISPR